MPWWWGSPTCTARPLMLSSRLSIVDTLIGSATTSSSSTTAKATTLPSASASGKLRTMLPPGASDGRSPLMICLEATGLTPKPLSTADHMIFMDDDGDLVVKIVLGEALARETMPDYVHAHRIGNYYFEFPGGKGDPPRSAPASRRTSSLDPHPGQRGWASSSARGRAVCRFRAATRRGEGRD